MNTDKDDKIDFLFHNFRSNTVFQEAENGAFVIENIYPVHALITVVVWRIETVTIEKPVDLALLIFEHILPFVQCFIFC